MDACKILKIVVKSKVSSIQINETKSLREFLSADYEASSVMAKSLGLPFELIQVTDGDSGRRLRNGSWTGMIGLLQRGEADMIVSTLTPTEERMEVVDFSYPFAVEEMTFATTKPEYVSHLGAFFEPFSAVVWISVILCVFVMSFIFYLFSRKKHSPATIFLFTFGILVRQDLQQEHEETKDGLLLTSWLIGATFLSSFYSAVLLSFLSFPPLKEVRNIPELSEAVSKGERWCATYPGGYIASIALRSDDPALRIIGRNLMQNPGSNDIDYVLESDTPQKPVFIGGKTHFKRFGYRYFVSDDIFFSALISVVIRKDFCCKAKLDEAIHYILAGGLIDKISADVAFRTELFKSRNITVSSDGTERQLTMSDFGGAFIFLATSHFLALFVFLAEILVGKRKTALEATQFGEIFPEA